MTADASISDLLIAFRRAMQARDDVSAEALAVRIDAIQGPPVEDDRYPLPIQVWESDA